MLTPPWTEEKMKKIRFMTNFMMHYTQAGAIKFTLVMFFVFVIALAFFMCPDIFEKLANGY